MGNWSNTPEVLLVIIAEKLKMIEDFVAFRGVCSSWRSAVPKENFTGITQLACAVHARNVVTLSKSAIHHLEHRPQTTLEIQTVSNKWRRLGQWNKYYYKERYFASKGWLFAISRHGDTCLFHSFSRAQIRLPHVRTLPECDERDLIIEAVLSSSPSSSSCLNNYVLIIRYDGCISSGLAFWRPGKDVFTELKNYEPELQWFAITCCSNGKLYALDAGGTIVVWDMKIGSNNNKDNDDVPVVQLVIESPCVDHSSFYVDPWLMLLVESDDGEVFTVARDTFRDNYIIHRIDVNNKKCVRVKDMGNRALFFGLRARVGFFMEPSEIPTCVSNHIYLDERRIYYKRYLLENTDEDQDKHSRRAAKPGIYSFPNGPLAPFKRKRHNAS
ncbi:uncharacterized protein [Nicotiana tomentosiformis]|uniref:uncharacterized protein n=1 Tax=Nicotiana tomentosiformis TaxID=4098 RepID=UPI00051C4B79|nr:uncharacterized protein LOC104089743 [Nicotiana tomentosiformis]